MNSVYFVALFFMSIIDDYIKQFEPAVRKDLERIRSIAEKLLPGFEETISYGMPTIKYKGKSIIGFYVHKNHIGIYPFSGSVVSKIKELENYSTTKSAIHEKIDQPLPNSLIEKIVRERMKQADV
jgi:uncharacterized protein YdhG (YjbR/CyaY superfamily)